MYIVGLDIGGTKCSATLSNVQNELVKIIDKKKFSSKNKSVDEILGEFSSFIDMHKDN